ncbi:hypothetical protein BDZ94DRAFT_1274201 [Collybia nuda]|uniref:Uncharacterized protein n=1 Tax=Collybia nuda TaxID=64659 RepID=A0A9P5XWV8_9AGAR|nr:hypothetical protein BDZ94DRAFT_1274201 [Collybia nuda]
MVEKVPEGTEVVKSQSGLIPIDCLRAVDQDLPAFMSERWVSIPYAESADGHTMVAL